MFDVIIIGGGPAGVAAAVYCARKKLKTALIADSFGGQSIVSDDIQNWIGDEHISGADLAKKLEAHARSYSDVTVINERATHIGETQCRDAGSGRVCDFQVTTEKNTYDGKTVIVASGGRRRRLGIPGEDQFEGKGVAFCSTCDAPIFSGMEVAVVGGGNAGLEAVVDLFPYATKIYLLEYGKTLKGDPSTQEQIKKNDKVNIIFNAQTLEVIGEKMVTGLRYKDLVSGEEKMLNVGGVFVEIGSIPNSEMVEGLVDINKSGEIVVDHKYATTSHPGVFAAGDVTDDPYKQNNISAGDAVKAALAAYAYLLSRQKN